MAATASNEVERLLLDLWQMRRDAQATEQNCARLIAIAPSNLPHVEMYLPQFAHMIILLADDLPTVAPIEKFVLSVCQLSLHVALQFFWLVYASLQENRLKAKQADRQVYSRCARLLLMLEQCVVYGPTAKGEAAAVSPGVEESARTSMAMAADGDATNRQRELMNECVRIASDSLTGVASHCGTGLVLSGELLKKGGGTSRCGRRNWQERYFELRDRVLYYYASRAHAVDNKDSRLDHPRASISLVAATVHAKPHAKYPFYFEVACGQSGTKFCLQARSREDMVRWCLAIRALAALPQPPGMAPKDLREVVLGFVDKRVAASGGKGGDGGAEGSEASTGVADRSVLALLSHTSDADIARTLSDTFSRSLSAELSSPQSPAAGGAPAAAESASPKLDDAGGASAGAVEAGGAHSPHQRARATYVYFCSQREFIRSLTNLAEELRFLKPEARQAALQPRLAELTLPSYTYFPLAHSSDAVRAILRFPADESVVFNTKARCPLMLCVEVREETYTVSELSGHLDDPLPTPRGAEGGAPASPAAAAGDGASLKDKKRESWAQKEARLRGESTLASSVPSWGLASFIVKSNDDLRQEVFIMQMMRYFASIWPAESTWLNCYHIEATGPDTGLIETIVGSSDLDRIKKAPGFKNLRQLFVERYGPPSSDGFKAAQANFGRSLAAYSIVMWILKLRDRHNGNLMLDDDGHYFHIDFGFCLGHSTGKGIGGLVECSPFKLTEEYIDVLDGRGSPAFNAYCDGCVAAMKASHAHAGTILSMVEIVGSRSGFPCFQNMPVSKVMPALAKRLMTRLPASAIEAATQKLVYKAAGHWGSRQYDACQNLQRGIAI